MGTKVRGTVTVLGTVSLGRISVISPIAGRRRITPLPNWSALPSSRPGKTGRIGRKRSIADICSQKISPRYGKATRGRCATASWEIIPVPRSWAERAYPNLVYFNKLEKGGHFAAWEQPELFAGDGTY